MMKACARCLVLLGLILALQGCADMSNPFSSSSSSSSSTASPSPAESETTTGSAAANPVYFDQFSDIPIPNDMTVDRKRTLSTTAQNGSRVGLITVTGRVDIASLNNAMIHNMARQGWALRAATSGAKTIQIYEKSNQYAVIYTYEELLSTAMEIWSAQRLDGSASSPASSGGSFTLSPTPVPSSGGNSAPTPLR